MPTSYPRRHPWGLKTSRAASCELARLRTRSRSDRRPRRRAAWFRTGEEGQPANPEASEREVTVESWTKLRRLPQLTNRITPTTVSRRTCVTGSFGHEDGLLTNQNLFLRKYLIVYSPEGMGLLPTQNVHVYIKKRFVFHPSGLGMVHSAGESATSQSAHVTVRLANHRRELGGAPLKVKIQFKLNSNLALKKLIVAT